MADVMLTNQILFLITLGQCTELVANKYLPEWTAKHISKNLLRKINVYTHGCFKVHSTKCQAKCQS